jgi:hypothetical protein
VELPEIARDDNYDFNFQVCTSLIGYEGTVFNVYAKSALTPSNIVHGPCQTAPSFVQQIWHDVGVNVYGHGP